VTEPEDVSMYEQRPPLVQAVQFDGTNADAVCALAGVDPVPDVTTGGEGDPERAQGQPMLRLDLYGWGPQYASVLVAGDFLVRHASGARSPMDPDTFDAQYRPTE
jgi:hypothetical protein